MNPSLFRFCLAAIPAAVAAVVPLQTMAQTMDANNSIIFGQSAYSGSTGANNAALGTSAGQLVNGNYNNSLGGATGMNSTGSYNTSIGFSSGTLVRGNGNIAIGMGALNAGTAVPLGAQGAGVTPFGSGAGGTFTGSDNVVFGTNAAVTNAAAGVATNDTVVIGHSAQAQVSGAVALGSSSVADRAAGVAGYVPPSADATQTAAIGATTSTRAAVSVGDAANSIYRQITGVAAGSADSDAVNVAQLRAATAGATTHFYSVNSTDTAAGNYNNDGATAANALAAGVGTQATAVDATAVGSNANAAGAQSLALGAGATASLDNNVALGAGSADRAAVQISSATVQGRTVTLNPDGSVTYAAGPAITLSGFAGTATGVVSVGSAGAERQIIHVAPGEISATSTDAINGSQLYAVANSLSGQITNVVNNASTHYYSVNDGGTQGGNYANNGATATNSLAAGVNAAASATNATAVGQGSTASGTDSTAVGSASTAAAANSTAVGSGAAVAATAAGGTAVGHGASTTVAGGVALGEGSVSSTAGGVAGYVPPPADAAQSTAIQATTSTTGALAVGDAASGVYRQVTGVAAGTADSDAVNVSQLRAVQGSIAASATHFYSVRGTSADGNYNNDGATGANSMAAGVGASSTATGASALGYNAAASGTDSTALGSGSAASGASSVALGHGSAATMSNAVAIGQGASATHAGSVALGSGSTTAAAVATTGGTINGTRYTYAGTTPTSTVSVGAQGAERTVTNVAAGQVSATSTDAVNGSQLHATNTAIESVGNRVTNVEGDVNNLYGITNHLDNRITAVDHRVTVLDQTAVKYDVRQDGSVDYNNITLRGEGGTQIHNVADGTAPMDAVNVRQLGSAVAGMRDYANAAASTAIALAAPPDKVPGKLVFNVGAGGIGGQYALGLTARKTSEDGRRSIYGGIAKGSNSDAAISIGYSFIWD